MERCPGPESGQAGKMESCKGCPNAKACASAKPDEDIPVIKDNLKNIKFIVAVLSGKGGVGKSLATKNIAASISKSGINTTILDLDLSGPSIPRLTKTDDAFIHSTENGFTPIAISRNLNAISIGHLERAGEQSCVYDSNTKNYAIKKILKLCDFSETQFLIIDTPPNITDEHLALVNYIKPNCCIILTTPQRLSFDDAIRQVSFCRKAKIPILGVLENMKTYVCTNCSNKIEILSGADVEKYCLDEDIPYLGSLELKQSIARDSDLGNEISEPLFDEVAARILEACDNASLKN